MQGQELSILAGKGRSIFQTGKGEDIYMNITYLSHSGFLIELDDVYFLFDYYEGELPDFLPDKEVVIFVSHKHADHYNRMIWEIRKSHPKVTYVVSKDVPLSVGQRTKLGLTQEDESHIFRLKPEEKYIITLMNHQELVVKTLRSTDEGVAFLIQYHKQQFFHAGDLNLWVWSEESKEYNENMTKAFLKQMETLKDEVIDVAFFPIDGRQGEDTGKGFDIFMETAQVKTVFPMHFWGDYDVVRHYKQARKNKVFIEKIIDIEYKGQNYNINDI